MTRTTRDTNERKIKCTDTIPDCSVRLSGDQFPSLCSQYKLKWPVKSTEQEVEEETRGLVRSNHHHRSLPYDVDNQIGGQGTH